MTATNRMGLTRESYTSDIADVLDRLVTTFEVHRHNGGVKIADPTSAPTLQVASTGGQLLGGQTFFYVFGLVDQFGFETIMSSERSITTNAPVLAPAAPVLATADGGTLAKGTHYYALTAVVGSAETQLGNKQQIAVAGRRTVTVKFPSLPAGADHFNVWRMGPVSSGFTKVHTAAHADTSWTDDGTVADDPCACDPQNSPPTTNTTNGTSAIQVSIDPTQLSAGSGVKSWRIYRSNRSLIYTPQSLVHEVVEKDPTTQLIVSSYVDTGAPLLAGNPQLVSRTIMPPAPVELPVGTSIPVTTNEDVGSTFVLKDAAGNYMLYVWDLISGVGDYRAVRALVGYGALPSPTSYENGLLWVDNTGGSALLYISITGAWVPVGGGGGGASGGYVEDPILFEAGGHPWKMTADHGVLGVIEPDSTYTVPDHLWGTPYPIGRGPCFRTTSDVWRLTVESGGHLVVTSGVTPSTMRDKVYSIGAGPRFYSTDGFYYDMQMDDSGALILTVVRLPVTDLSCTDSTDTGKTSGYTETLAWSWPVDAGPIDHAVISGSVFATVPLAGNPTPMYAYDDTTDPTGTTLTFNVAVVYTDGSVSEAVTVTAVTGSNAVTTP